VVRRGDTLRTTREIVEVRRSASNPDRGTIRTRGTVLIQPDETVMTYFALGQVRARSASPNLTGFTRHRPVARYSSAARARP
jgi:acyl dehydratase